MSREKNDFHDESEEMLDAHVSIATKSSSLAHETSFSGDMLLRQANLLSAAISFSDEFWSGHDPQTSPLDHEPSELTSVVQTEDEYSLEDTEQQDLDSHVSQYTGTGGSGSHISDMVVRRPPSRQSSQSVMTPRPQEFFAPMFSEFSDRPHRRRLVDHFCNVLSHLIVFREESGNPFQQLVLPLSIIDTAAPANLSRRPLVMGNGQIGGEKEGPVLNAIYALSSAHLEYRGCQSEDGLGERSCYFQTRAIQGLTQMIASGDQSYVNEILAAIMLLVYYEVLVQRGRNSFVDQHLRGALTILSESQTESSPTSDFLERAFRFYDVITALSQGTAPLSAAPGTGGLQPFPPLDAAITSPMSNVDTLLGMATNLWPIMHRLSSLLQLKSDLARLRDINGQRNKAAVLAHELETTSKAIESALTKWKPCLPPDVVMQDDGLLERKVKEEPKEGDDIYLVLDGRYDEGYPDADGVAREKATRTASQDPVLSHLQSILGNALAYRHSAFVYLYRTIYELPAQNELVQEHTRTALRSCVATTRHRGPMSALLWPLFVAACEATTPEDRDLAKTAFEKIDLRQGMANIQQAWNVVQAIWSRVDSAGRGSGLAPPPTTTPELSSPSFWPPSETDTEDPAPNTVDMWREISAEMGVNIVFG